jgi:hypothetical protein
MKLNKISNVAVAAANTQPVRHQLSARTLLSGHAAAAERFGAGFIVLPRPWATQGAGGLATDFAAQLCAVPAGSARTGAAQTSAALIHAAAQFSTAPASGPCASKQYQQMAPAFATSGGEVGPHPPREPA